MIFLKQNLKMLLKYICSVSSCIFHSEISLKIYFILSTYLSDRNSVCSIFFFKGFCISA